jgi:hypothetical protein
VPATSALVAVSSTCDATLGFTGGMPAAVLPLSRARMASMGLVSDISVIPLIFQF